MVKKTVAIFTTTRADFGILSPLIHAMERDSEIEPLVFVGGTHLASEHGKTINEIKDLGITVTDTFDYLLNDDNSFSLSKSMGIACFEIAHVFRNHTFDYICVLGDRFEMLSIIINAILFKKPIIHISGGEKTEGVIDEQIRHMITKAAHLHFVACEEYGKNVEKMGEHRWRIHNTGALNVDNMVKSGEISKEQLFGDLGLNIELPTVLMTYHPVTLEYSITPQQQVNNLFTALKQFELQVVVTGPNSEVDRDSILSTIMHEITNCDKWAYFESLGVKRYHGLIPYCEFVIGNSSSGIGEVPFFRIPTVNIGDRQAGRIRHRSIIDTDYSIDSIKNGIERALSSEFRSCLQDMVYKFGEGDTTQRMINIIKNIKNDQDFIRK